MDNIAKELDYEGEGIGARIRYLISKLSMSASAFAKFANVNYSTLHTVIGARKSKANSDLLSAILKALPQLRSEWLLNGEGYMFKSKLEEAVDRGDAQTLARGETRTTEPIRVGVIDTGVDRDHEDAIPFVPIAAEGSYLQGFADEEYIEHMPKFYLPFLGLGSGVYAFQVRGDSMSDRFNNGDVVFGQKVEKNDALRWGEVYVLLCNDGLVVKELRKGPDELHFTLRSYNEHFDPYDILKTEVRQLFRYQASISFNSSNPNRGGVVNFMRVLSEQMGQVQNSLSNLPQAK
jgi:phage repressor protein C with HTH and peptisase S24 domain